MLPLKYRLKKRKQFAYIHKHGKHVSGDFVLCVYCGAGNAPNVKIGFSASKKVGNSIIRHRAVRLMREGVRPFLTRLQPGSNYIFTAKENITKQHLLYITLDIEKMLQEAGLLQ